MEKGKKQRLVLAIGGRVRFLSSKAFAQATAFEKKKEMCHDGDHFLKGSRSCLFSEGDSRN